MTVREQNHAIGNPVERIVGRVLDWDGTWLLARLALVGAYLLGGVVKLTDWPGAVAEQVHFGMSPPALWAALTILVELAGPVLILLDRALWLGAGALGVFTVLAALVANDFWSMAAGQERFMATNAFFEHLGLAGGFALAAMLSRLRRQVRQAAGA
ncbi:DoxX family protein [Azospirillum picis]|uniref:Membrane protein YphA (DoxX/SURF4 family) n=1 Tax=Azospirillum picis TaxID=488438 RepID=A0ABU0MP09_9PROT|nr:DoxX family protein [Azospirillum picis]MBP2301836.1 putative membrane protein YphA (DoxX/SURF4 family) [Azospirillum picis]MDQ0534989.1 putative membrane protein YphA (DoxX/SURF4 family) [Azospirillum picis]